MTPEERERAREYSRRWRTKHPERYRQAQKDWRSRHPDLVDTFNQKRRDWRKERREKVALIKLSRGCVDCGYNANPMALDFDHVRGEKVANLAAMIGNHKWEKVVAEIEKCEVRCANCHRIKTANDQGVLGSTATSLVVDLRTALSWY